MNKVATYAFTRWLSKRTFVLFIDRVTMEVASRFPDSIQETHAFPLRCLIAAPVRSEARPPGFLIGLCGCLVGLSLATAWLLSRGLEVPWNGRVFPLIMAAVGLAGLVWTLWSIRRWQYATFYSEVGGLVFTLQCPPGDRRAFEEFVDAVTQHIKSVDHAG